MYNDLIVVVAYTHQRYPVGQGRRTRRAPMLPSVPEYVMRSLSYLCLTRTPAVFCTEFMCAESQRKDVECCCLDYFLEKAIRNWYVKHKPAKRVERARTILESKRSKSPTPVSITTLHGICLISVLHSLGTMNVYLPSIFHRDLFNRSEIRYLD